MRWVCYLVGALIALYLGAVAVMSTAWFHGILVRQLTAKLQDLTGARVEIGDLRFRPAVFQLTLRRLVLHGTEGPSEPPLFSAGRIVVTAGPLSPFRKKLLLHRFDLEDAEIHIQTRPDGSTNLPGPKGPAGSWSGAKLIDDLLDLSVGDLTVARTAFFWDNQQVPLDLSARDVAIVLLRSRLRRQYSGSVASSEVELRDRRWALPPLTFSTRLEFSRSELALDSLVWRTSGATAGVWGSGSLSLSRLPSLTGQASLRARGDLAVLARAFGVAELESGSFDWEAQASFANGKLGARGRAVARDVRIRSSSFEGGPISASADYTATPQRIDVSKLIVSLLGGSVQGRAEVLLRRPAPKFTLRAELAGLDLDEAFRSLLIGRSLTSRLPVAARISGTAEATWIPQRDGAATKLDEVASDEWPVASKKNRLGPRRSSGFVVPSGIESRFDVRFEPPSVPQPGLRPLTGSASGTATLTPDLRLNLTAAEFHLAHSSLNAQGSLSSAESNLQFRLATSDFEEERPLAEFLMSVAEPVPLVLKSAATYSGIVTGTLASPQFRGQVRVGAFEYGGWAWDSFQGDIFTTEHSNEVTSGRLVAGASSLQFDVKAGLENWLVTATSPLHIVAKAEQTPLEGLLDALKLRYPVSGKLTGHMDLSGTETNLAGNGALEITGGTAGGEPFDSFSARVLVAKSIFDLEGIQAIKGKGKITGQAHFDTTRRAFSAQLQGAGFLLSDLAVLAPRPVGALRTPELSGIADFDVRGGGTEGNLQLHATLNVRQVAVNGSPIGDVESRADWQGSQIRLEGELTGAEGKLHWMGGIEAKDDWPIQVKGQYKGLRLESWVNLLPGARFPGLLMADGSFDVAGSLEAGPSVAPGSRPPHIEIHSLTDSLQLRFPTVGLAWRNEGTIDLLYSGQSLRVNRLRMEGPSTDFSVEGSVNFGEPPSVALQARGRADAGLLSLIDPAITAVGRFDLNFRAGGAPTRPLLYGTVTVADLSLGYSDFPFRLAGLNGEIQMEGDRVTIKSLRGAGGGGTLGLSGFATLGGAPHYDFRADFNQARIEFPIEFTSVLSGNLHLVGTAENGTLDGDLTVGQMFVPDNFDLLAWMGRLENTAFGPSAGAAPPFGSKVRMGVQVASEPQVRIESRNLSAVLDIHTSLRGTLASPVVFGDIRIESGEAPLRGNRYKVTRGDISFTNPFRTQPSLDIEATTRIQHYNLTLDVTGPMENARLNYRSDPPLATPDILSLLALGYSKQEQSMGVTGARQGFGTQGASALLSQALSTQASGRLQRLFGVSQISLDPNVGGPVTSSSPRLTLVEQPVRDFTLTFSTNTANSQQRVIQLEWALSDKVSIVGERDQNGVFGLELKFRRSFR
jgi:translocation and assembly module TamB